MRRKLAIGGVVLAACACAGGAYAASTDTGSSSRQAFLDDAAKRAGVSPQRLKDALEGALQDRLQAAVKAGKLTQAEANAIEQRLRQGGGAPVGPLGFGGGFHLHRFGVRGGPLSAAAGYLGLSVPQLLDQLRGGKSLAQVAASRHKSTSGLENAIVSAERTRLEKERSAGEITKQQEQAELGRLQSRVTALVNHSGGFGQFRFRVPGSPGGPPPSGVPGSPGGPPPSGVPGPPPGADAPQPPDAPPLPY